MVVPAYNETTTIPAVVPSLLQEGYTVLLVDDGSRQPVAALLPPHPGLYILRHHINLGQGAALQTGFDFAIRQKAAYIITFDADGQHHVKDIDSLIRPLLQNEADVALGSRFLDNKEKEIPAGRRRTLRMARRINNLITGLPLTDVHNGLRAFTAAALKKIKLRENRMAHATEIITQIKKAGLRYKEVPVHIQYTAYSRKKGQTVFSGIRIFFDLLLHKLFE